MPSRNRQRTAARPEVAAAALPLPPAEPATFFLPPFVTKAQLGPRAEFVKIKRNGKVSLRSHPELNGLAYAEQGYVPAVSIGKGVFMPTSWDVAYASGRQLVLFVPQPPKPSPPHIYFAQAQDWIACHVLRRGVHHVRFNELLNAFRHVEGEGAPPAPIGEGEVDAKTGKPRTWSGFDHVVDALYAMDEGDYEAAKARLQRVMNMPRFVKLGRAFEKLGKARPFSRPRMRDGADDAPAAREVAEPEDLFAALAPLALRSEMRSLVDVIEGISPKRCPVMPPAPAASAP